MSRITNKNLVLEAIRRARRRTMPLKANGHYVGSDFEAVLSLLESWMTQSEIRNTLNDLLAEETILISCQRTEHKRKDKTIMSRPVDSRYGVLTNFHPDASPKHLRFFYSTERGTPLGVSHNRGRKIIGGNSAIIYRFYCRHCYIVADGYPKSLSRDSVIMW